MAFIVEIALPYEGDDCLHWPYSRNNQGYGNIRIGNRAEITSRYVCLLAHGSPPTPKHQAAHSCGNGHLGCVNPKHIRWATVSENLLDRVDHGTSNRGERHPLAKLTEAQVREILRLEGKFYNRQIAEAFGVCTTAIEDIYAGRNWSWLTNRKAA